jgi:hypothetical protein
MGQRIIKKLLLLLLSIVFVSCGGPSSSGDPDGVDAVDHRLFISSVTHSGKFLDGALEGLDAADKFCVDLAKAAGFTRDYKAILSDTSKDAQTRLFISGAVYTLSGTEKTLIAESGADLWNTGTSPLKNNISRNENGDFVSGSVEMWTGTNRTGGKSPSHCNDWKSDSSTPKGSVGQLNVVGEAWIDNTFDRDCNSLFQVYCISQ